MIGRRASYLNPIRMYVFTSAIFFLLFFTFYAPEGKVMQTTINGKTPEQVEALDSASFSEFTSELNDSTHEPMTKEAFRAYVKNAQNRGGIHIGTGKYKSRAQYDSALHNGTSNDGWFQRMLTYKQIEINEKYHGDQQQIVRSFINTLLHSFPQILFISLPIFALILKILYWRRKEFYYGGHAIFGVHFYVFIFIALFLILGFNKLEEYFNWEIFTWIITFITIYIFYYEYKAMRIFYGQRRAKTILKFILLNMVHLLVIGILLTIFTFYSLMKI